MVRFSATSGSEAAIGAMISIEGLEVTFSEGISFSSTGLSKKPSISKSKLFSGGASAVLSRSFLLK